MTRRLGWYALALLPLFLFSEAARADDRPTVSGEEKVLDTPDGRFRVHYTLTGADAIPDARDEDPKNGIPDLIDDFVAGLSDCWDMFVTQDGWTPVPDDEGRGGDNRLDVYVQDIDANGYTHYEKRGADGKYSSYIRLSRTAWNLGRVAAKSVAAHELHHALQAAVTVGAGAWLYEATATWAQYLLYPNDGGLTFARNILWQIRLGTPHYDFERDGMNDRFEYAGLTFVKFLLDYGKAPRTRIRDLWNASGRGWKSGFDATLAKDLGFIDHKDAVEKFHEWNLFACKRADGSHYSQELGCTMGFEVTKAMPPLATSSGTLPSLGPLGAAYVNIPHDCVGKDLQITAKGTAPIAVRAVSARPDGVSTSTRATGTGSVALTHAGWNDDELTTLMVVNLSNRAQLVTYTVTPTGTSTPRAWGAEFATAVALDRSQNVELTVGDTFRFAATATTTDCSPAVDGTAVATWRSTDEAIVRIDKGVATAVAPGVAEIYATIRGHDSEQVSIIVSSRDAGASDATSEPMPDAPLGPPDASAQPSGPVQADSGSCSTTGRAGSRMSLSGLVLAISSLAAGLARRRRLRDDASRRIVGDMGSD